MSNDDLLAKLRGLGVDADRKKLAELCDGALSAEQVVSERFGLHDWDADWAWICLTELWHRWWPEKACLELLDDKGPAGLRRRPAQRLRHQQQTLSSCLFSSHGITGTGVTDDDSATLSAVTSTGANRPKAGGWRSLNQVRARLKGALVTRLARPRLCVVNTHPVANKDGDWSRANRFYPLHQAQLAALARIVRGIRIPAVMCGDFNVDRGSSLFAEFVAGTGLAVTRSRSGSRR